MTFSFNLIDQPWIPCQTQTGEYVELSLYEFLVHASDLWRIAGESPLVSTSILAFVVAVLCRAFEVEDDDSWSKIWHAGAFPQQPLENYLSQWYTRFDLFHSERPFYQGPDDRVERKSVIHLVQSIGNTGTLFTHHNEIDGLPLLPASAAQYLLIAQLFRTAGLSGLEAKFTDAPFARGVLYWAWGNTVFETLWLNCMLPPISRMHRENDMPCWEMEDPFRGGRQVPSGYLDYLTWQTNHILLFPEQTASGVRVSEMTIAPARRLDTEVVFSPHKRYEKRTPPTDAPNEVAYSFQYFNEDKDLWRDYATLLPLRDTAGNAPPYLPPTVVDRLANLAADEYIERGTRYCLMACGMLAVQAKVVFYRQLILPLPLELLHNTAATNQVSKAIKDAEEVSRILEAALKDLARNVLMRGGDRKLDSKDVTNLVKQWDAQPYFWSQLEPAFWPLVDNLATEGETALANWHMTLRDTSADALQIAVQSAGTDVGALKGQSIASRKLSKGLKDLFRPKTKGK